MRPVSSTLYRFPTILLLFAFCFSVHSQTPTPLPTVPSRCSSGCVFRNCLLNGRIVSREFSTRALQPPGKALLFRPCRRKRRGGRYFSVYNITIGEPLIKPQSRRVTKYVPVSEFKPPSVNDTYPKRLFKPASLDARLPPRTFALAAPLSSVQFLGLALNCIRIPIHQWQFLSDSGRLSPVRSRRRPHRNDCLEFRAFAPAFNIHAEWDVGDDIDLVVDEPGGFRIDAESPKSPISGCALASDNGISTFCVPIRMSETVSCSITDKPAPGIYKVFVRRRTSCGKDTPWRITVARNGTRIQRIRGVLRKDEQISGPFRVFLDGSFA